MTAPIIARSWQEMSRDEFFDLVRLRAEVFIRGQQITDEPEVDETDRDPATVHVWIPGADGVVAYLRLTSVQPQDRAEYPEVTRSFGRVAVHPSGRGAGHAQRLVAWVIERYGSQGMLIHAQEYVCGLYEKFGFSVIGDRYQEAGIPHLRMIRRAQG